MPEITDTELSEIRTSLPSYSQLVQRLVARLDSAEQQLDVWRRDERARCLDVSSLIEENTTLRRKVERL